MEQTRDFLFELGTEELPPVALLGLSQALTQGVINRLQKAGLSYRAIQSYGTPRRLALLITDLLVQQPDRLQERRGPALAAAFDGNGQPTKAAEGFARSCGVTVEQLGRQETEKGTWLVFQATEPGKSTQALLPEIIIDSLAGLPIPKRMRWGALKEEFVRPVHWAVALWGDEVLPMTILGVATGRETRGHRFHHPASLPIPTPQVYESTLADRGKVIADFTKRRTQIIHQLQIAAQDIGGIPVLDDALLDEVTGLVEWPVPVMGAFSPEFLQVPQEALISTMKGKQKYFPLVDKQGQLLPHFITISNIESLDPKKVQEGNNRVVRPRLADAAFFWKQDQLRPLASRIENLKGVVFQDKLGTLYDKATRVASIAAIIAQQLASDPILANRAAQLAKCDLLTDMVGEFPELQGIMGRHYARLDGETVEVSVAIEEHYLPRFAGDQLPQTVLGKALAIADRLDTLVGMFGIGAPPTGDRDPFGLRRAALGILRISIEGNLDLDLLALLEQSVTGYGALLTQSDTVEQVYTFIIERLRTYYGEQGIRPDTFEAVAAKRPARPVDFDKRIRAVHVFRLLPEATSLTAANKRIRNILRPIEGDITGTISPTLLQEVAERNLADQYEVYYQQTNPLFEQRDYQGALTQLAGIRDGVDVFFEQVMVMAEDEAVRQNRLILLKKVGDMFLRIADISCLQI